MFRSFLPRSSTSAKVITRTYRLILAKSVPTGGDGVAASSACAPILTAVLNLAGKRRVPSATPAGFKQLVPFGALRTYHRTPRLSFLLDTHPLHSKQQKQPADSSSSDLGNPAAKKELNLTYDREAIIDLFHQYAGTNDNAALDYHGIYALMKDGLGMQNPNPQQIHHLFAVADENGDGEISLPEFLENAAAFLGRNPARIILVVGGPGSGKGVLSARIEKECHAVHLSSGSLLRDEVAQDTALGRQVAQIMQRGELVSSAVMVALMKKRMQDHPGKRVLLDGFPRSLQNAEDLVSLCGRPELALHLECDDTILMERIMTRVDANRDDDNFHTALRRLRTYHAYHDKTLGWLREQHVPIVNLDCSGSPESVWRQLVAIGRLMRPAVALDRGLNSSSSATPVVDDNNRTKPNSS